MQNNQTKSRFSKPVRILALVLSILVTGSALTFLLNLIFQFFS